MIPPHVLPTRARKVGVEALADYAERIDTRSPAEFADDHIPGAINCPVLDDEKRAVIGTMHAQVSAFTARRVGAALVARNIAQMLETTFADKPREWAPLVYCWRGGQRSSSLTHVLAEIGWHAVQLDGGYRAYRRHVIARLEAIPPTLGFRVVCGLTGSGKSRLLSALAAEGAQVLDLETLARHRGSMLGDLPGDPQPSQRWFESQLWAVLETLDPARPVYVESESRRIGTVQLPDALLYAMRSAPCVVVETPTPLRVELLKEDYIHFLDDADSLNMRLSGLLQLHGRKVLEQWREAAAAREWDALVSDLLERHYDPMYRRSIGRNYPNVTQARIAVPTGIDEASLRTLARWIETA